MKLFALAATASAATACTLDDGENQFEVGGRTVRAFVPSAGANKALPAIIDFHGYGGSGLGQASLLNTQAESEGFVHVYPDGTGLISGWNGQGCCPGFPQDDVAHTRAIVSYLQDAGCVDNNLFATGFSNGGFMAYRLYCEAADLFKGIAPMSGTLSEGFGIDNPDCEPSGPMTVVHFHGTRDTTIPYNGLGNGGSGLGWAGAQESIDRVVELQSCSKNTTRVFEETGSGSRPNSAYCDEYDGCDGGNKATLCTIDGMGHSVAQGGINAISAPDFMVAAFMKLVN